MQTLAVSPLFEDLGHALSTDYFFLREQLTDEQLDVLRRVRAFVDDEVLPEIGGYWERAELPWSLINRFGELGILGEDIQGYGCPGLDPIARGLAYMELSRGDGSLGTVLGVQSGLAMKSIYMFGSEEQKEQWLPPMARLAKLGAFALTEPEHGSDSVALEASARRHGDEYVIDGAKRWIGNGGLADVTVVWARAEDGQVKRFLVEKGMPGYHAEVIEGKGSLRAIWQAHITLDGVRVPVENRLPGATASRTRLACWPTPVAHAHGRGSGTRSQPTRPRSRLQSAATSSGARYAASRSSRTGS